MTSTQQRRHLTIAAHAANITPEASNALQQYNERMLLCRENQHRWPDMQDWHWSELRGWRQRVIHYKREMTCERCGMKAIDLIDAVTGSKEPRTYQQPEGYRIPSDLDIDRADLRLEMVRRFVKDQPLPVSDGNKKFQEQQAAEESSSGGA